MGQKVVKLVKSETILVISVLLAIVSCFFIPPDKQYFSYIKIDTLLLLFGLMAVMAGLKELGFFRSVGIKLLKSVRTETGIVVVLVLLCFFSSMIVTNDVALITFVPFALLVLNMANLEKLICLTVTLQTLAANLGSMATPIGNPHNLYLYTLSKMTLQQFMRITLPYGILAFVLLIGVVIVAYRKKKVGVFADIQAPDLDHRRLTLYLVLLGVCLLSVAQVINTKVMFLVILAVILVEDKSLLKKVDYCLIITFIGFFVFIGNMSRFPALHEMIARIIKGHEALTAIVTSQVISNVPATLLLADFSNHWKALIVGTNLGGLGTLIASMASLISYKKVAESNPSLRKRYLWVYTLTNVAFLAVFLVYAYISK